MEKADIFMSVSKFIQQITNIPYVYIKYCRYNIYSLDYNLYFNCFMLSYQTDMLIGLINTIQETYNIICILLYILYFFQNIY